MRAQNARRRCHRAVGHVDATTPRRSWRMCRRPRPRSTHQPQQCHIQHCGRARDDDVRLHVADRAAGGGGAQNARRRRHRAVGHVDATTPRRSWRMCRRRGDDALGHVRRIGCAGHDRHAARKRQLEHAPQATARAPPRPGRRRPSRGPRALGRPRRAWPRRQLPRRRPWSCLPSRPRRPRPARCPPTEPQAAAATRRAHFADATGPSATVAPRPRVVAPSRTAARSARVERRHLGQSTHAQRT